MISHVKEDLKISLKGPFKDKNILFIWAKKVEQFYQNLKKKQNSVKNVIFKEHLKKC